MKSQWYYSQAGQQQGPVSAKQLKQLVVMRHLGPTDLVWKEGMAEWTPAVKIKGLCSPPKPPEINHSNSSMADVATEQSKETGLAEKDNLYQWTSGLTGLFSLFFGFVLPTCLLLYPPDIFLEIAADHTGKSRFILAVCFFLPIYFPFYILLLPFQYFVVYRIAKRHGMTTGFIVFYFLWVWIPILNMFCFKELEKEIEKQNSEEDSDLSNEQKSSPDQKRA